MNPLTNYSEADLRLLAETLPHIIWISRSDGTLDFINQAWSHYTGFPPFVDGKGWEVAIHPDDAVAARNHWETSLRTGRQAESEVRIFRASDRTYRWHLARALIVRDEDGEGHRWFGSLTEIDGQKRAEKRQRFLARASVLLCESLDLEATLRQVAELALEHFGGWVTIALANASGRIDAFSVRHPSLAQGENATISPEEYFSRFPMDPEMPHGPSQVIRTGVSSYIPEVSRELLEGAARNDGEREIFRKTAIRSAICVPLKARNKIYGAMNFSSPARSYTRDDLALAEDLARIAGRLPELIARCENNADRLSQLIDNLLDLTRIRQGRLEVKRERADLAALAREAVARSVAGHEGTPIEIDAPEPVPGLWDHLRIEQVISNLVSNAIKYGEGRPVRITVSRDPLRGEARLAVEDQGIGIAPEDQQRLFNIFERAANARSRGGLGLGLYIARQIVEAHDGRISVESAPGRGSRFTITLPQGEEHP